MDNTMSFYVDGDGNERNREVLFRTQRFSRALIRALDKVTVPNMQRALAEELGTPYEILTPAEISAVVARRARRAALHRATDRPARREARPRLSTERAARQRTRAESSRNLPRPRGCLRA
jgi:hypothetical protein